MDKRKLQADLEVFLYILTAKAELDNLLIGIGNTELAMEYIWKAYELADSKLKKLLKRVYDLISNGDTWKARQILEKIIEKDRRSCPNEEF